MRLVAVFGLLVCALLGCRFQPAASSDNSYVILIDPSFTEDERYVVIEAVNDWEDATGVSLFYRVEACDLRYRAHTICLYASRQKEHIMQVGCGPQYIGCTSRYAFDTAISAVFVNPKREVFKATLEHELGHAIGLDHGRSGTVMAPIVSGKVTVTCRDVQEFWRARHEDRPCYRKPS